MKPLLFAVVCSPILVCAQDDPIQLHVECMRQVQTLFPVRRLVRRRSPAPTSGVTPRREFHGMVVADQAAG